MASIVIRTTNLQAAARHLLAFSEDRMLRHNLNTNTISLEVKSVANIFYFDNHSSHLFLTNNDLTPVGIGGDDAVLLEHQLVPDAAVDGHIEQPWTRKVMHTLTPAF